MNVKELTELRDEKLAEMEAIVETRSENMDAETLGVVKDIKAEIAEIENKIEAINELRTAARLKAQPQLKEKTDQEELRSAFADYLKGNIDHRSWEKRANTVAGNGDLVPEEFYRQLFETIDEYGAIGPLATHFTTADNGPLSIPVINDTGNQGQWLGELDSIALADFSTETISMAAWKVATGISVSQELLSDSAFNIVAYIAKALGERIGRTVENAYIYGDGASKPLGITKDAKTVHAVTSVAGEVTSSDLIDMIHAIPYTQRQGAKFFVSDEVMAALLKEKDQDGRPIMQPSAISTVADDIKYSIGGYEVITNFELQGIAANNTVAIFGNPKNYYIRDVRNLTLKRDDYTGMNTDEVKFYTTYRLDAKVVNANTCFVDLTVAA